MSLHFSVLSWMRSGPHTQRGTLGAQKVRFVPLAVVERFGKPFVGGTKSDDVMNDDYVSSSQEEVCQTRYQTPSKRLHQGGDLRKPDTWS